MIFKNKIKKGKFCAKGIYMCGQEYKFENVDYDEARTFIQKTKQGVIYDEKGRRLYEYFSIDK